jgi:hypothetical protein
MKTLKMWSHIVTITLWLAAIVLAYYQVIPWWVAVLIIIAVIFLGGYITLLTLRAILGSERYGELVAQAVFQKTTEEKVKDITQRVGHQVDKEVRQFMEPLEAQLNAQMKELSTKSELGYQKASAAYLAGEGDPDYKRNMKQWYRQMEAILTNRGNPEQAAKLRATLEHEYTSMMIPDWDKAQIAKLLGKK